jgi:hypothetical protein
MPIIHLTLVGRNGFPMKPNQPGGALVNTAHVVSVEEVPMEPDEHHGALAAHSLKLVNGDTLYLPAATTDLRVLHNRLEDNTLCFNCCGSGGVRVIDEEPPAHECCPRCGGSGAEPDEEGYYRRLATALERRMRELAEELHEHGKPTTGKEPRSMILHELDAAHEEASIDEEG